MPFNGTNPHSVVILDNCSIHHVPQVAKSIQDVDLPPTLLSGLKSDWRIILNGQNGHEMDQNDIETLLLASFALVTTENCIGWIRHIGVYNM